MEKNLSGKLALVTGASSGIGKAIAEELIKRGATVIVHYNNNKKAAIKISKNIVQADLSLEEDRVKLVNQVKKLTKRIDILVNNAGFFDETDGPDIKSENLDKLFSLHVVAALRLCSLLHPLMNDNTAIINISSIHGVHARPHAIGYSASKAAIISITESLAQCYAPIRVNAVSPGPIFTPMWGDTTRNVKSAGEKTLLKRFAKPEEIAKVVVFLASDDSSYITGANIIVDGGALLK